MIRTKLGLLGLCAVMLGMMAMSTSAAQAAFSWLVLNATGTVNTEVIEVGGIVNLLARVEGEKDSADLTLLTKLLKLMISVTCTNFSLSNVNLEKLGTLSLGKAGFTGCEVYSGAALESKLPCTVKTAGAATGTIDSANATSKLVLHTFFDHIGPIEIELWKEVLIEVKPDIGTTFATLLFEGAECSLPASNPVTGSVFLKDSLGQTTTFAEKHLIEQGSLTLLTVGSDTAEHLETSLIGPVWVKLGGAHTGLKFAGMDTP